MKMDENFPVLSFGEEAEQDDNYGLYYYEEEVIESATGDPETDELLEKYTLAEEIYETEEMQTYVADLVVGGTLGDLVVSDATVALVWSIIEYVWDYFKSNNNDDLVTGDGSVIIYNTSAIEVVEIEEYEYDKDTFVGNMIEMFGGYNQKTEKIIYYDNAGNKIAEGERYLTGLDSLDVPFIISAYIFGQFIKFILLTLRGVLNGIQ